MQHSSAASSTTNTTTAATQDRFWLSRARATALAKLYGGDPPGKATGDSASGGVAPPRGEVGLLVGLLVAAGGGLRRTGGGGLASLSGLFSPAGACPSGTAPVSPTESGSVAGGCEILAGRLTGSPMLALCGWPSEGGNADGSSAASGSLSAGGCAPSGSCCAVPGGTEVRSAGPSACCSIREVFLRTSVFIPLASAAKNPGMRSNMHNLDNSIAAETASRPTDVRCQCRA
mmetsp:Transcript_2742/g.8080  ORF Transcript_2742/g.8080 Transcript_2742/m.8080 type:complete len:231 (+) Transcript_2742:402-1094(+)